MTSRNVLDTLNRLVEFTTPLLSERVQLHTVSTPRDLYEFRLKMKDLQVEAVGKDGTSLGMPKAKRGESVSAEVVQALANVATNAWRTRNKMTDEDTGEAREGMKRVYRHVEALFDALSKAGIEVRDMQGRAFDSGMALKVISFEQTPGLSREEIIETIKPTVIWKGQLIQMGEVIVGTPETR